MKILQAVFLAALVLWVATASEAYACSCEESSDKQKFSDAHLVLKGRMRTVTYGVEIRDPASTDEATRVTRGDFEIEHIVKGDFDQKTLPIYTGSGFGDCGRLGDFLNAAFYYNNDKFGLIELGVMKTEFAGQTFYFTSICDYARYVDRPEQ
ncbi:hypothetical protein [Pararhizobium gei]|uniref:hypothetical protein n=1 Tax=Pararhizobium gei TaxID=1395951 RepID=UPI0023DA1BB0|nr:hypothetical protein [Rhizobium gei]